MKKEYCIQVLYEGEDMCSTIRYEDKVTRDNEYSTALSRMFDNKNYILFHNGKSEVCCKVDKIWELSKFEEEVSDKILGFGDKE